VVAASLKRRKCSGLKWSTTDFGDHVIKCLI